MIKLRFLFFFTLGLTQITAQNHVEKCGSHILLKESLKDSLFNATYQKDQLQLKNEESVNLNKAGTIYKIPVVFHILHNGGAENISNAQVLDALKILNRDFRKQNSDLNNIVNSFQHLAADIEINFVLASIAPNGDCFNGITRTKSPRTIDTDLDQYTGVDQVDAITNGNDVYQGYWDPSKYLNFYICKTIAFGAAGYTNYPNNYYNGSMYGNGIFMRSDYVGAIGTSTPHTSRTPTHEVGHWLNLPHTWGATNEPGLLSNCNSDDGVIDTPNTIGVSTCSLSESSCGVLANVENYMDYSYCRKMFTTGQKSRMRTALTSSIAGRNNLWQTANLIEVGVNGTNPMCAADFYSTYRNICVNNTIDFTDASYPTPTSWNWIFQGGTPSTSTSENPTITYNTPGTYPVILASFNSNGSVSETKTNYVNVLAETGIAPIQEGFEHTSSIPSYNWFINNIDNGVTWKLTNTVAAFGNNCVMINNSQNSEGDIDELESTTITLDLNLSASISFDYAFASKNNSNSDKLTIKVSSNCGQTWNTKKSISGSTLETAPNTSAPFTPDNTQWKTATISSNSLANYLNSDFRIKFIFECGGGSNFYLDNININGPVTIEENKFIENFSLYPNPATNEVKLSFENKIKDDSFSIKTYDIVGKEIENIYNGVLTSGEHQFLINTEKYLAGVYMISLNDGVNSRLQRLIIK